MIPEKLRAIYAKYGNKAVYPVIFFLFLALNIIGGIGMAYPATDPNELSVISAAQFFAGRNWSGIMSSVDYYYGFLQSLIYTPIVLVFDSPMLQYAAIIAVNSAIISVVPLIVYSLAFRMKVGRVWKCLVAAFVSGGYCCYFAHTKFAWTETVTIVMPWVLIWLVFRCGDCKSKVSRFFMSVFAGFMTGLSFAAHIRLIAVIVALFAAILLERLFFGKKLVNLWGFVPSFILTSAFVAYITYLLQKYLWCQSDPSLLKNTLANMITGFPDASADGFTRFTETLFAQLYYFAASTWGLGAVALCLAAAVITACIKHKVKKEPQTYENELSVFTFYTVLSIVLMIIFSTFYRFGSESLYTYQDTMMFGRFLDGIVPFATVLVMMMLFTHSISLNKILGATAILSIIYVSFAVTALPDILNCDSTRISPVLGLYPLRIGASSSELLNFDSLLLTMSMTYCVMGGLIVIISCSKTRRSKLISIMVSAVTAYSLVFISVVYLPVCISESREKNESVAKLSEYVFDQAGAPSVTAYNISRHDAMMLQFLNHNIIVKVTNNIESVSENSFLAVNSDEDVSALESSQTPFLLVGDSGKLRLYAYGERAVAYMRSQTIDEAEEESVSDDNDIADDVSDANIHGETETTKPTETTTMPAETTVPQETTSFTTELPPVSTYTTPSVITLPADSYGDEDEWAAIIE